MDTESLPATQILAELAQGDGAAAERLFPMVYEELRALAGSFFRQQRANHTLQPTALVHEAFVRLIQPGSQWKSRAHFMAVAATAMRQVLIDYARRSVAQKRGGDRGRVSISHVDAGSEDHALNVIALDDVLRRLAEVDARQHRVVELRFFGGLEMAEIAEILGVSKSTVELDWRAARAWLSVELAD